MDDFSPISSLSRSSAGLAVALCALAGCAPASATVAAQAARVDFSASRYCPLDRIDVRAVIDGPPATNAIARDPERMALWVEAHMRQMGARQRVEVDGCGERLRYTCWALVERVPSRHGYSVRPFDAACVEDDVVSAR